MFLALKKKNTEKIYFVIKEKRRKNANINDFFSIIFSSQNFINLKIFWRNYAVKFST